MTSPFKSQPQDMTLPHFESLEQRVLLTTLHEGQSFVYLNSQGDAVRIDLKTAAGEQAQIELLAYDYQWGKLTDLVGVYDCAFGDPTQVVKWDNGAGTTNSPLKIEVDSSTGAVTYSWQPWAAATSTDPAQRGAETEIFAIYVTQSTANTYITISTLETATIPTKQSDWAAWYNNIETWTSTPAMIGVYDGGIATSPTGSGGVIIGASRLTAGTESDPVQFFAAKSNELVDGGRVIGTFPGGKIAAGITIASSEDFQNTGVEVGTNVQSIAVASNTDIYMVNLGLNGNIVNANADGILGKDVDALASNNNGSFYSVDNTTQGDLSNPTSEVLGGSVQAIAANGSGKIYAVDEATHHLVSWDEANGVQDIGLLIDNAISQFRYDGVASLTFDPTTGTLYGIASTITDLLPDSSPDAPTDGPFLITIDIATGRVLTRTPITYASEAEKREGNFASIAISASGLCYAVKNVEKGDYLYQINLATGVATEVGCLTNSSAAGITSFGGLEFIGETLYGVTNNALYWIKANEPQTTTLDGKEFKYIICQPLAAPGFGNPMTSLTYDSSNLGAFYTTVLTSDGYHLAKLPLAGMLATSDSDGVLGNVDALMDSGSNEWIWRNVYAMDYNSSDGMLYAIATPITLDLTGVQTNPSLYDLLMLTKVNTLRLVMIDPATGLVTDIGAIAGNMSFESVVFGSGNTLYGVENGTNKLYTIPTSAPLLSDITPVFVVELTLPDVDGEPAPFEQIVGLEFVNIGGNELLFGNTSDSLYIFDMTTGKGTLIVESTINTMTSLAYDSSQSGALWSTSISGSGYRLTQINLYSELLKYDPDAEPDITGYTINELIAMGAVDSAAFDGYDLGIIGGMTIQQLLDLNVISQTEVDALVANIPDGVFPEQQVEVVGLLADADEPAYAYTDVHALEFTDTDILYGIGKIMCLDPSVTPPSDEGPYIIVIDTTTGLVTRGPLLSDVDDISSLAYNPTTGLWYGVVPNADGDVLVNINMTTGVVTTIGTMRVGSKNITGVTGIDFSEDPDLNKLVLYAVTADEMFSVATKASYSIVSCKKIRTMSPALPASMSSLSGDPLAEQKFWTTAKIDGMYYLMVKQDLPSIDIGKIIVAGTVAGQIDTDGNIGLVDMGFLWGQVRVGMNLGNIIMRTGGGALYVAGTDSYWAPIAWDGEYNASGGTITEAGSRITVGGTLGGVYTRSGVLYSAIQTEGDETVDYPTSDFEELETRVDAKYYDAAWLEGLLVDFDNDTQATAQFLSHPTGNFTISGTLGSYDSTQDWYGMSLLAGQTVTIDGNVRYCVLKIYDNLGNYVDSFGYETEEDEGIASRGTTLKPITFTALSAGVYYLVFEKTQDSGSYSMEITNGTAASLGAVSIVGAYGNKTGSKEHTAFFGTGDAEGFNIAAKQGGNIGAISISGISYGTAVYAIGGGDLIAFQAGQLGQLDGNEYSGMNTIQSDSNIGQVASLTGQLDASIIAGASSGVYNNNAFIQNIYSAAEYVMGGSIMATGSIGVIEITGDLQNTVTIAINSDNTKVTSGNGNTLDLLDIGGDYDAYSIFREPVLYHGPGGDIKYVHVDGTIYILQDGVIKPITPTTVTNGNSTVLRDDSGGTLTISPIKTAVLDSATGLPLKDIDGNTVMFTPTYSYSYIPVDDYTGGVGGVIANLTIDGSVTFSTTGLVQISDLELTGADSTVTLNGSGRTDVYYAHGAQLKSLTTNGNIVSGNFTGITKMNVAGNIGSEMGKTKAWVYGHEDAPAVADITTEPEYGWFHGKINGLNISGDITTLNVGGSLQDLRVTGKIGTVVVDSDGVTAAGDWDGVNGIVWSGTRIDSITVGDGLADDGAAYIAKAAIMSTHSIGTVKIVGPYHVENGIVYGLINGAIIARTNDVLESTNSKGVTTYKTVDAITSVIGTGGARLTALVLGMELDSFQASKDTYFISTGGINEVNFSGAGAWINGAEIAGHYVRTVTAAKGTYGIANSHINGDIPPENKYVIGTVTAGGAGFDRVFISANGGSIGTVKTLEAAGDIVDSAFVATNGMNYIGARNIVNSGIHMPGKVNTISATGDITDSTVNVGALGTVTVKGNFSSNSFSIAGELTSMTVGGSFINSYLATQGLSTANLKSLKVTGDISGEIISGGQIGSIISTTGLISADISTLADDWSGNIGLIQTADGYTGQLEVAGTLNKFISYATLGENPLTGAPYQAFNIIGNLNYMKVAGDMFVGLNVGGNVGTLDIDGTFYSSMYVNGNITSFIVDGGFGGVLGALGTRGELNVMGTIKTLKFNTSSDLIANLTVGGSISGIALTGGDIIGNLTSRYGSINAITLNGGSIIGDIQANSIGNISVKGGQIVGDISAVNGNINSIVVTGNLNSDVTAVNGMIKAITVTGNITAGHKIEADGGIGSITVKNGDLMADVVSHRNITAITVANGDIDSAHINAEAGIGTLKVTGGTVVDSTVRSGTTITTINVADATNSIFSSAWSIGTASFSGAMTNSYLLAGYDIGNDNVIGGGDDAMHSGDINSLVIKGLFNNSVVAAGINPGDGNFKTLADNTDIPGVSSINKVSVTGGVAGGSVILADTYIDPKAPAAAVVAPKNTQMPATGTTFGPEVGNNVLTVGGLTLTLTGAGRATYNTVTKVLVLNNTTVKSALTIANTGANVTIVIDGSEDSQLGSLVTTGNVTLGDVSIYGAVNKLSAATVANGSTWELLGGSSSAVLGNLTNVNMTTGQMTLKTGSFTGGSITADALKSLYIGGNATGDIETKLGDATGITITGDSTGDITTKGTLGTLSVTGSLSGVVTSTNGDLLNTKVTGNLTGRADAVLGSSKGVSVGGNFTGSFRTAAGVGSFTTNGAFSGLLSTDGNLTSITTKGAMTGRVRAGGSINSATFASMNGALVTAAGDFLNAKITGDMTNSQLFAGFDSGDSGFSLVDGEDGNLEIDAFVPPLNAGQLDREFGGNIKSVTIGGYMTNSTISAAVGPGEDGYCGTGDDVILGAGTITKVVVGKEIYGYGYNTSYGVFAANNLPAVYNWSKRPFESNGTAHVKTMQTSAGLLAVTDVQTTANSITIFFNHPVNSSTIGTEYTGTVPGTLTLLLSEDGIFDTSDVVDVTADVAHVLTFNSEDNSVTLTLLNGKTWKSLPASEIAYYQLTLNGTAITDNRGFMLDGDYNGTFPSGDGQAGGDFVYNISFGSVVLEDVPTYSWWFGCSPTAAGMLVGYYDNTLDDEIIIGDANDQIGNPYVNEMIASSGDGVYGLDQSVIVPGTPGTGNIPDYALYDEYNDYSDAAPYNDLSSLHTVTPHDDDCLADFMLTGRSAEGLTMGSTYTAYRGTGITDYIEYRSLSMTNSYTAVTVNLTWGIFTWNTFVEEINAGRPVLFSVDSNGDGVSDHSITAIGYNTVTHQYFCHTTWADIPSTPEDESMGWYDFTAVADGQIFGISSATLVEIVAA